MTIARVIISAFLIVLWPTLPGCQQDKPPQWSPEEVALVKSLMLPDANSAGTTATLTIHHNGNAVWNNKQAAKLGHKLFFDKRLSANGKVACANCHQPQMAFTDNLRQSQGIGSTVWHTPTIIGIANSPWFFWDGRADSLWTQALGPLENPVEHGANRMQLAHIIYRHYREEYETVFEPLPDLTDGERFPAHAMPIVANKLPGLDQQLALAWQQLTPADKVLVNQIFVNIGKSIAAYEGLLLPGPSRFDVFAKKLQQGLPSADLTPQEQAGLKLFIDDKQGQCIHCHNGPMFTNHDFKVTGIADAPPVVANQGRIAGIAHALADPFNCFSQFSEPSDQCAELKFAKYAGTELQYAVKVPTLRNIALTAPYMHNGSMDSLIEVLRFYNKARPQFHQQLTNNGKALHFDLQPLGLLPYQLQQLNAFLGSLNSLPAVDASWLTPPLTQSKPSANSQPGAEPQAAITLPPP
ncbi:cytochrome-c peroxidase [Thalassotalea sp. ND16A]|uniref:cytochrome-c peroxidase n=1 Tax=Thalassotalea sp. ND16A TaxID=1535422 RepID=UPI00051D70A3|nr:cytochrome c peroxidase [Thalassotalea sp. ND16A]KGJ96052.1 hypothetical protein ND16A_1111 [Thalassotalea sp. ND16A]